ncbi:alpha/beta hydrolase fold-3 domain-containing protein [Colletotrichum paranaense]|uniref:Alpha/beta hydrolase fold-3 domain-containing protein n=1 Tax=Colletotrichum paranaense TaxID=1914294 RepID=A0ABQ9SH65_9PEZI|nr:alpha/beta hydrolase fold-3 domain-containing protein [Colletotrichum paranaense]KAK1536043.1 alpha/beta hydrolase fold-3 domain-containing protein [Colletotrichum paranaense]
MGSLENKTSVDKMEYDTKEKLAALSVIDPEIAEYLAGGHPLPESAPPAPDTEFEYTIQIPMRDGGRQQEARVHKPSTSTGAKSPVIVLIYGGAFTMGDCHQMSPWARIARKLFNATVINLSYRLAPTHPFPAAPNDVEDGLKWVSENAHTLGGDLSAGFVIGGPSAGANLAAVMAQKMVDGATKLGAPLTGVWLLAPLFLEDDIVPPKYKDIFLAREQNAEAPIFSKAAWGYLAANYKADIKSVDYSPFNSKNPHVGMPRTVVQVGGLDFLRDDGLVYEKALRAHGVETRLDVYPGAPHGHFIFPGVESAFKANLDIFRGLGWLLKQEVSEDEIKKAVVADPFMTRSGITPGIIKPSTSEVFALIQKH